MGKLLIAILVLISAFSMAAIRSGIKVSKILDLETMEVYDTHLVHAG